MSKAWRIAVVGATGLVGETMIQVLQERQFPVSELFPLASQRSIGKSVEFNGRKYPVEELSGFDFKRADMGLFSAGSEISAEFAPAYHIERPEQLDEAWFQGVEKVGVTAGASTPDYVIREVIDAIEALDAKMHAGAAV